MFALAIFVALSISNVYGSACAGLMTSFGFGGFGVEMVPFDVCLVTSFVANSTTGGDYEAVKYECANNVYTKTTYMTNDCSDTGMAGAEMACDANNGCMCDGNPCAYDQATDYENCEVEADGFERDYMIPDVCFKTTSGFYKWSCYAGFYFPQEFLDNGCTEVKTYPPVPTMAPVPTPAPLPTTPWPTRSPTTGCRKWRDCTPPTASPTTMPTVNATDNATNASSVMPTKAPTSDTRPVGRCEMSAVVLMALIAFVFA